MTRNSSRLYTIDAIPPENCYPIHFTADEPLRAPYGTIINIDGVEHMCIPSGWIDAMGNECSHEQMKKYLIEYHDVSRVVHNTHYTGDTTPVASAIQPTKKKEVQYVALRTQEQTIHHRHRPVQ